MRSTSLKFIILCAIVISNVKCVHAEIHDRAWAVKSFGYNEEANRIVLGSDPKKYVLEFERLLHDLKLDKRPRHGDWQDIFGLLVFISRDPNFNDPIGLIQSAIKTDIFEKADSFYIQSFGLFLNRKEHRSYVQNLAVKSKGLITAKRLSLFLIDGSKQDRKFVQDILEGKDFFQIEGVLYGLVMNDVRLFNPQIKKINCVKDLQPANELDACMYVDEYARLLLTTPRDKRPCELVADDYCAPARK